MMYWIEIGKTAKCWLIKGEGNPPRSVDKSQALVFQSLEEAKKAIQVACKSHPDKKMVFYTVLDKEGKIYFEHSSINGSSF